MNEVIKKVSSVGEEDITVLSTSENFDGSLFVELELSEKAKLLFVDIALKKILMDYINGQGLTSQTDTEETLHHLATDPNSSHEVKQSVARNKNTHQNTLHHLAFDPNSSHEVKEPDETLQDVKWKVGDRFDNFSIVARVNEARDHGLLAYWCDYRDLSFDYAKECRGHDGSWRLPSANELNCLWEASQIIGGFDIGHYWSSSVCSDNSIFCQNFVNGVQFKIIPLKDDRKLFFNVRLVKTF